MIRIFGVIYKATDPFGKCYIGKHKGDGSDIGITYFGSGKYQKRAWKKYGKDYFTYTIIEKCYSLEHLNEMEIYYIKFFQARINGYNQTDGGDGGGQGRVTGYHYSEDAKKKQSDSWANRPDEEKALTRKKKKETWANKPEEEKEEIKTKQSNSNKIAQNRPEAIQKHVDAWNNKSDEEKAESIRKQLETKANKSDEEKDLICTKISVSMVGKNRAPKSDIHKKNLSISAKLTHNKPEMIEKHKYNAHVQYHKNKNVFNPNCKFCTDESLTSGGQIGIL